MVTTSPLSSEQLDELRDLLTQLQTLLEPLPSLTPKQRQRLTKQGSKSQGFVDYTATILQTNPTWLPNSLDTSRFLADHAISDRILEQRNQLRQLSDRLSDLYLLLNDSTMSTALEIYSLLKALQRSHPELNQHIQQLSQRFVGQGRPANLPSSLSPEVNTVRSGSV